MRWELRLWLCVPSIAVHRFLSYEQVEIEYEEFLVRTNDFFLVELNSNRHYDEWGRNDLYLERNDPH